MEGAVADCDFFGIPHFDTGAGAAVPVARGALEATVLEMIGAGIRALNHGKCIASSGVESEKCDVVEGGGAA